MQQRLKRQNYGEFKYLFPLDSTIITLTSKLSLCFDINPGNIGNEIITFGQTNDQKIGNLVIGTIPEDAFGIMDRGFGSWKLVDEMCQRHTLFIVRIRNNMKLNPDNPNVRGFNCLMKKITLSID
ncbi:MAG: transposase [Pseudanabaenaceae cyanobacterium]